MEFLINVSPRDYQKKILENCVEKNCLVVLPTGLGKTLIALMLSIDRLKKFPGQKVLFLAPTKPLAEQHLNYFKKHLPELFAEMEIFTGNVPPNERRKKWQTSEIIFSTPQCIANDLKNFLYDLSEVCLLIEDEAHKCLKSYDYTYVVKQYKEQAKNQRILGLTASPGSEKSKIMEICRNLSIEKVELRTRDSDDVKNYLQELEFRKIFIDFPSDFDEMRNNLRKILNKYIEELRSRKLLHARPTKTELINLQKKIGFYLSNGTKNFNYMLGASTCAQAIKIQHALELLETQTLQGFNNYLKDLTNEASKQKSKGVVKLAAKPEFIFTLHKSNELLKKNLEHPKIEKIIEIIKTEKSENPESKIIIFTQFRETAQAISKEINKNSIKSKIFVGQAKKSGNGESTGLSQKEQKEIIQEFGRGEIEVLCATCIGEEGLDIPEVSSVIFYETIPSAIRSIQRAGRTARLNKGKLIILLTKDTKDEINYYVSKNRERKMYSAIDSIEKDFMNRKQKTIQNYGNGN